MITINNYNGRGGNSRHVDRENVATKRNDVSLSADGPCIYLPGQCTSIYDKYYCKSITKSSGDNVRLSDNRRGVGRVRVD